MCIEIEYTSLIRNKHLFNKNVPLNIWIPKSIIHKVDSKLLNSYSRATIRVY